MYNYKLINSCKNSLGVRIWSGFIELWPDRTNKSLSPVTR